MKKTILILLSVLAGLAILCSFWDKKSDYMLEQVVWHANKKLSKVARSPETVPDAAYEEIADQYRRIIKEFPESKITPAMSLYLANVYMAKKDYEKARKILAEVFVKYPKNQLLCAEAYSSIGRTYEIEGNWPLALQAYEKLKDEFPLTD